MNVNIEYYKTFLAVARHKNLTTYHSHEKLS